MPCGRWSTIDDHVVLAPMHTHPYLDRGGVLHAPVAPPTPPTPTQVGAAEQALIEVATQIIGTQAPSDLIDAVAALVAHGTTDESVRPTALAALCTYVRAARPLPPADAKRRPRPSPGVVTTVKAIGQCGGWGPIDLHGSHLHDLRFTGRSARDRFVVAGDLDLHGCLLTGRTRLMWTRVEGSARLDGVFADGDFDIANTTFVGSVSYARSRFTGRRTSFGTHESDVDARGIECTGATYLGQSYGGAADFDGAHFHRGIQSMNRVEGPFTMRNATVPCEGESVGDTWRAGLPPPGLRARSISPARPSPTSPSAVATSPTGST